jgi:hypothetical protein
VSLSAPERSHCELCDASTPDAFESHLAAALRNFAWVRVSLGAEVAEAFDAILESVAIYRRLAPQSPESLSDDPRDAFNVAADILVRREHPNISVLGKSLGEQPRNACCCAEHPFLKKRKGCGLHSRYTVPNGLCGLLGRLEEGVLADDR